MDTTRHEPSTNIRCDVSAFSVVDDEKNEKETSMKKLLFLAILGLSACETPAEISAREQIDAACVAGNLQACAAVQQRVAADNQNLAITSLGL